MTYLSKLKQAAPLSDNDKIKVVLVDDSNVARSIFERVLVSSGMVEVVGCANSACEAIDLLNDVKADIILLDIEMPSRSGLDALPEIIEKADGGRVIIVSSFVDSNGPAAIKALSLGACDTLCKPGKNGIRGDFSSQLIHKVTRLGALKNNISEIETKTQSSYLNITEPEVILIGASTGGIPAIQEFLSALSENVTAPICIAQHLPEAFISFFARQISLMGPREVKTVYDDTILKNDHIYIAPGDGHLTFHKSQGRVCAGKIEQYSKSKYTPSVDALFHSAAQVFGGEALAILLSGMGKDGCDGAIELFKQKSTIWSQDENSSVVWGMPGSVVDAGVSTTQLSPTEMAKSLNEIYKL